MLRKLLNERTISALPAAPPGKRIEVFDTKVDRFGVRVTDRGEKSFILYTRFPGRAEKPTRRRLGRVGKLGLDAARRKARRWLDLIEQGIDPAAEEDRERREELRRRQDSFATVAEEYIR